MAMTPTMVWPAPSMGVAMWFLMGSDSVAGGVGTEAETGVLDTVVSMQETSLQGRNASWQFSSIHGSGSWQDSLEQQLETAAKWLASTAPQEGLKQQSPPTDSPHWLAHSMRPHCEEQETGAPSGAAPGIPPGAGCIVPQLVPVFGIHCVGALSMNMSTS